MRAWRQFTGGRSCLAHAGRLLLAAGLAGLLVGCVNRITPPPSTREPTTVYIVDYGVHASLLLPRDSQTHVEYAFGEWEWFALDHDDWYRAIPLAVGSHPGALGRRRVSAADESAIAGELHPKALYPVTLDRSAVDALLQSLDTAFDAQNARQVYGVKACLDFVPSERTYGLFQNCNTVVADWLGEAGCEIGCKSPLAVFVVEPPR